MQLLTAGKATISGLAFAPDGRALVVFATSAVPVLWHLPAAGDPLPLAAVPTYTSGDATFSPEPGATHFSADAGVIGWLADQNRHEFDLRTSTTREVRLTPTEGLNAQAVCGPDGLLIVRTIERGAGFRLRGFAPDGRGGWAEAWPAVGPSNRLGGWHLVPTAGDRFFTGEGSQGWVREGQRLVARSARTGAVEAETLLPSTWVYGFAAAPDGSALVAFKDSSLYVWRPGEQVQKVRTGTLKHYRALAFHPDGRHLLAGNNDTTARLIDSATWEVVRQYTWAIGRLAAVAVSPDGQLAAAGGAKGQVVVWDLDL